MKRLCFVTTVSMTVRAFVIPVIRYFSEMTDWEITVICDDDPTLEQDLPTGIRYIPISMKRGISLSGVSAMLKMYQLFRREKFDLVQYSTPNAALYASMASWLAGIQNRKYHLMGFRYLGFQGIKRGLFKLIEKFSCALSSDIECVSKSNMDLGIQEKVFPSEKAHVVFHGSSAGIDLGRFRIENKPSWRKTVREELGYDENQCVFGYAGRITRDKGINELLAAFKLLSSSQNRLLLIGSIENLDALDEKLLRDAENDPHVLFHEYVDDIERYYAAMDVLVLPSYREGFGNIIIEAQAMGVPVIVTDIPGPIDAVKPMETGITVPVADIDALSAAMNTLAKDSALRSKLGQHGRKLVEEQFDQKILLDHFLQERKSLLNMPD